MFFRREMADAAFQEFRECLEASVATDPPIGEDQFRDVGQQLAEITLAAHPELAERIETLKAAQFRALATRSQEWCVRVLKEEVSKADLGGGGGGGGRSFEQRMSAVLSAFMERASGPARDATLVGFCCSGELLQLFGEFDFNVMGAERQAQAAECGPSGRVGVPGQRSAVQVYDGHGEAMEGCQRRQSDRSRKGMDR